MKICKYCKKEYSDDSGRSFSSHVGSCKMNPASKEKFKKGAATTLAKNKRTIYYFKCKKCNKEYELLLPLKLFNRGKYRKYCCRSCANTRKPSKETKKKISNSVKNNLSGFCAKGYNVFAEHNAEEVKRKISNALTKKCNKKKNMNCELLIA